MTDGRCNGKCPCGNRCDCDWRRPHTLHICANRFCPCHSRERYTGQLVEASGRIDPLGMHWRATAAGEAVRK